MAKDVIITPADGDIQFENSSGTEAGKIEQSGDDLVISNAVGDVLIGDGSSDVYIGDGTNNVDIIFEQDGAIKGETAAGVTLTIGSSDTTLIVQSPTLKTPTIDSKLTFTTSNSYILFDHESGSGEYNTSVPLIKVQRDSTSSEQVILERTTENGGLILGIDDTIMLTAGDTKSTMRSNIGETGERVVAAAESGLAVYAFPNNDTSWSNRKTMLFDGVNGLNVDSQPITGSDVKIDNWGSISASLATISASAAAGGGGGGGSIDGSGAANKVAIWSDSDTLTSDTNLHWDSSNDRLGIGTSSPSVDLDIENTTGVTIDLNSSSGDGKFRFQDAGVLKWTVGRDNTNQNFAFSSGSGLGNGDVLTLTTTGLVGIGTSSPSEILDIKGDNPILELNDSNSTTRYAALKYLTAGGTWYFSSGDSNAGAGVANSDLWITRNATGTDNRFRFHRDTYAFSIYSGSNQNISLNANGNSYFNGGSVGIGITSPSEKLHVDGVIRLDYNASGLNYIEMSNGSFGYGRLTPFNNNGDFVFDTYYSSNGSYQFNYSGSTKMVLDNQGRLGIANSSPSYDLEIGQDGDGERDIRIHSDASSAYFEISTRGNIANLKANQNQNLRLISTGGGGYVTIATGGDTERFRVNYDGNVGIGITAPTQKLEVREGLIVSSGSGVTDTGFILDRAGLDTYELRHMDGGFTVYNSTETRKEMSFNGAGNVGIGTTSSPEKLTVEGNISASGELTVQAGDSATSTYSVTSITGDLVLKAGSDDVVLRTGGSGTERIYFQDSAFDNKVTIDAENGRLGIGTTDPETKLDVRGNALIAATTPDTRIGSTLEVYTSGSTAELSIHQDDSSASSAFSRLRFRNGGNDTYLKVPHSGNGLIIDVENQTEALVIDVAGNTTIASNLTVQGSVTAQEFHTEFISASILFQSGSTKFGDDIDDVHNFTGSINLSGSINLEDNAQLKIGTGNDLRAFHNGTNSVFENITGNLSFIQYADDSDIIFQSDDGSGGIAEYFRLDGSLGYTVASKQLLVQDNVKLSVGTSEHGIVMVHDGSNSTLSNAIGDLTIQNFANDKDIVFKSDDGSGGTAEYFRLDGSSTAIITSKNNQFTDSTKLWLGSGNDLEVYHNGTNSVIESNTNDLIIKTDNAAGNILFQSGSTEFFRLNGSSGITRASKSFLFVDNAKGIFGDGSDLQIYHDGSNSFINNDTGHLYIKNFGDDNDIVLQSDDGSGGITTYLTIDGSATTVNFSKPAYFGDNIAARFGNNYDLEITHNGTNSVIDNDAGDLYLINTADNKDIIFQSDDGSGGVTTYFQLDGSNERLNVDAPNGMLFSDNIKLKAGTGGDLEFYHNGTNSVINNITNNLQIINNADDGDISFQSDDGAGGTAEYFRLDGGATIVVVSKEFRFTDNIPLKLGSGPDFEMLHNGTNTTFLNNTGNLVIRNSTDDGEIVFESDDGSGGTAQYFRLDGGDTNVRFSKNAKFSDNVKAQFGGSNDLEIYHDSSNSYINDTGIGSLIVQASDLFLRAGGTNNTNNAVRAVNSGTVTLFHANSAKLDTTSTGVTITGDIDADDITIDDWGSVSASLATINAATVLPSGVVSSSAQIDHDQTTNFNSNEHFTQANITTVGTVTSGDVSAILPSGVVSGSIQIDHDATTNFVANEHIDHSGVSITAGDGLSGGGNITATRTLTLNTGSTHFSNGVSASAAAAGFGSGGGGSTPQVSVGQYTSTDTTTDVNTASFVIIPFNSTDGVTDTNNYSISSGRVTISEAGTYWVYGHISYDDNGASSPQRGNVALEIFKNGTSLGYRGAMGYLRNSSGHDEASSMVAAYVSVSANDIIDIRGIGIAAIATCNLVSGESVFALNKVGGAVAASNTFADAVTDTGTALDLQYSGGSFYSMGAASSATSYTLGSTRVGGWAKVFVNASSKPSVAGSTEMDSANSGFVSSTDCYLVVTYDGSNARHFFTKI